MNWPVIIIAVAVILQEIQIILLKRDIADISELAFTSLLDKARVTILKMNDDDDEEEDNSSDE